MHSDSNDNSDEKEDGNHNSPQKITNFSAPSFVHNFYWRRLHTAIIMQIVSIIHLSLRTGRTAKLETNTSKVVTISSKIFKLKRIKRKCEMFIHAFFICFFKG